MTHRHSFFHMLIRWLSKYRYVLLCGLILFKVAIHTSNGSWYGDFWEHSAVISELINHPISPRHPQLDLNMPHAFYTPYAVAWALIAKIIHIDAIGVLTIAGLLNFILLAVAIREFSSVIAKDLPNNTAFYSLIFIMFLWGENPWSFSGFLHYWILADVLPYPSTFTIALSFIAIALNSKNHVQIRTLRTVFIYVIALIVLLTHPLTFIFLCLGLSIQSVILSTKHTYRVVLKSITSMVIGLSVVVGLAMLWPYYSLAELLASASSVFDQANEGIYSHIFTRIWPVILALPLIGWAFHDRHGQSILILIAALISIYVLAYWLHKYSFGRVIGMIILLIQILAAEKIARIEAQLSNAWPIFETVIPASLFCIVLALSMSWLIPAIQRSMTIVNSVLHNKRVSNQLAYKDITFLSSTVHQNDLIISDIDTSWLIPTFGGRIIATKHPIAFVSDQLERKSELDKFFSQEFDNVERLKILKKYKPKYLLLDKHKLRLDLEKFLNENDIDKVIFENERYRLILLNQNIYRLD